MADETNRPTTDETEKSGQEHDKPENKIPTASGDPGRTPGAAEGDEETIDEDIRQKEAEGKL